MIKKFGKNYLFKYAIVASIIASNALSVSADKPNNGGASEVPLEKSGTGSNGRPKSPERDNILCYYENGKLYFTFAYSVGQCYVRVTDFATGTTSDYSIDSSVINCEITIGDTTNALIEITTSNGKSYQGILAV